MPEIVLVPINNIIVGKRHRQDLGDLDALAGSINSLGLLQPIGVDSQMNLVFGQRRMEACRSLEWESIPARVIDVPSLLAERDENEVRKDFTPSERVVIGRAVEDLVSERHGSNQYQAKVDVQNIAHPVVPGQKSREIAAQAAGFGNTETYRQAKQVVENGTPELVNAMDKRDVSVSAASVLAKLPQAEQNAVLAGGKEAVLDRVRQARDTQSENGVEKSQSVPAPVQAAVHPGTTTHVAPAPVPVPAPIPAPASIPTPVLTPVPAPEQAKSGVQAMLAGLTGNCEWYTPSKWIEKARSAMGSIDVDPASSAIAQGTVQAAVWYDQERDGLKHDWAGNVWLNPPYARGLIEAFIDKVVLQFQSGITTQAVVLVDNRSDTKWFHSLCSIASSVAFTKGRVNFYNETSESSSPVSGSAFVYLGHNVNAFAMEFDSDCLVLIPHKTLRSIS